VNRNFSLKIKPQNIPGFKIVLYGDNFNYIEGNGLYLSGNNYNTERVDLYSEFLNLSTNNPPFSGIPIKEYKIIDTNKIEFYLPVDLIFGKYDVIFCNPAGYYKASSNKKFKYIIINDNNLFSISGKYLKTIDNKYIKSI